jgi:hypothetical protein
VLTNQERERDELRHSEIVRLLRHARRDRIRMWLTVWGVMAVLWLVLIVTVVVCRGR